jgi:hypothetical protein
MTRPSRKKQTAKVNAAERRMRVAQLACEGKSQRDIARELRVDQGTVSRDLRRVRREWREQASDNYEAQLGEELAHLAHIQREAWAGWRRSVEDFKEHRRRITESGEETTETSRAQAGAPRFLLVLLRCHEQRTRLLGLGDPEIRERASREREGRAPIVEIIISEREQIPRFLDYAEFEARQVAPVQIEGENLDDIDYAD